MSELIADDLWLGWWLDRARPLAMLLDSHIISDTFILKEQQQQQDRLLKIMTICPGRRMMLISVTVLPSHHDLTVVICFAEFR